MRRFLVLAALLCAVSFLVAPLASAQTGTGKINGKVTDAQGGVLPGATVMATEVDTGLDTTVTSNAAGIYVFPSLPRGNYRVTISLPGFNNFVREGLVLITGLSITVDASLQVAGVAETITVTGESPMIATAESKVGGVVENVYIENAPINTRDVQQLALLVPGARPANRFDPTKSRVPAITFGTNASGRGVLFTIDGGDNTDDAVGGIVQQISMDSVQEFEVVTARFKAEHGRSGGGAITIVTKSGTNQFKGSVFEFFRDKGLNAKTQPEKDAGIDKAPYRRHQFGAALGGPIVSDRSFFFVTYERVQEDVNSILTVPPEALAAFSPAFIESAGGLGVVDQPFRRNYLTAKFTQQFNPNNRLDVRFAYEDNVRDGDQIGTGFGANFTGDAAAVQTNDLWSILGRHQLLIGQQGLNEFVFQASDFVNEITSITQSDFHTPGKPTLFYPSLTTGQNQSAPQRTDQRKYHFRDSFSWTVAEHDMKFGGELLWVDELSADVPFSSQGQFYYANDGDPVNASFDFTQFDFIPPLVQPNKDYGLYAQDDWRITSSLTLNLGVRYDLEVGTLGTLEYSPNALRLINDSRSPFAGEGLPEDDKNNVAPRLGFAWDIGNDGKTVVRGGYGLFFDKIVYNASLFTDADFLGVRGVEVENPTFGPNNLPPFDSLFAQFGFPLPQDPIIAPGTHFQFARTQQVTFGISQQITPTLALDVDYVRADTKLRGKSYDLNERNIPGAQSSRLFFPQYAGRLRVAESLGEDRYNGLQVSLRKRFRDKATFTINYTLGKLEGTAQTGWADEAECRACLGNDRDYGPLNNDTRNRLVLAGVFQLPADFQVSAFFQGESGRPYTAFSTLDKNGNGRRSATSPIDFMPGANGEPAGRGNALGDGTYTMDIRVVKFFRLGGSKDLQVMFEGFNLFNRVNKGRNFEPTFESSNFGGWQGELWTDQFQAQLGIRFTF